jgi:hypothetical protein
MRPPCQRSHVVTTELRAPGLSRSLKEVAWASGVIDRVGICRDEWLWVEGSKRRREEAERRR